MIVGYNDQLLGAKLDAEIAAFTPVRVYLDICHIETDNLLHKIDLFITSIDHLFVPAAEGGGDTVKDYRVI
jgi:hypothetical protein